MKLARLVLLSLILAILSTGVIQAQEPPTTVIPDTGQDRCYGDRDEIAFPKAGEAYFGQDAQAAIQEPRYAVNDDGTVSDHRTGLIWQKSPAPKKLDQDGAEAYAASLELAGHDDWRLPSIKELFSLADLRGNMHTRTPYIDTKAFDFVYPSETEGESGRPGQRSMDAQYATSTRYLGITMGRDESAFGFNFADGRIKSYPLRATRYVRCVRGNPAYGQNRFDDNGDGSISDHATGLIWQKNDAGEGLDWKAALAYAADLDLAGRDDWRLPSIKELQSIVDYSRAPDARDSSRRSPAIDPLFELSDPTGWCWSSTTHIENQGAYYVCFGEASSMRLQGGKRINAHGAGAVRSDPKSGDPARWPEGLGPQADEVRIFNLVLCVRGGPVEWRSSGPAIEAPAGRGGSRPQRVSRFIERLDEDGDGKVSRAEFDGPDRGFGRHDANNDGFIDADEAPQGRPGRQRRNRQKERQKPQTLQVITVGTGSPLYNPERSSPCTLVKLGDALFVVDMGEGTAERLSAAKIRLKNVAAFCFTHHHRDHNADAMTLLPLAWSKQLDIPILGPESTRSLANFLRSFFEDDLRYRVGNRGGTLGELPPPTVHELPLTDPLTIAGVTVTVAQVNHTITTFAYRFEAGGRAVVVSGDLSFSESLITLAKGADLLVMDSGGVRYEGDAGRRGPARSGGERGSKEKKVRAHASLEEVARMAAGAEVGTLILTHFRLGTVDEEGTRKAMSAIYSGQIIFAEDGQTYE